MLGVPESQDSLTLYGSFTSSSSYKPMLYLALAGLPFSFRTVNLKIGVQSTPEYLAINRWGVVPSLRHRGLTILQSNVILDYLARETGHFEGRTEQARWQVREWLSWEADHITAVARIRHSAGRALGDERPEVGAAQAGDVEAGTLQSREQGLFGAAEKVQAPEIAAIDGTGLGEKDINYTKTGLSVTLQSNFDNGEPVTVYIPPGTVTL